MVDLVQDLVDPVTTFLLRLTVLYDPSAVQTYLDAPAAVLPLEDAAFVVASLTCHLYNSSMKKVVKLQKSFSPEDLEKGIASFMVYYNIQPTTWRWIVFR